MINVVVYIPGSVTVNAVLRVLASVGEVIPHEDGSISVRVPDGRATTLLWDRRSLPDAEYFEAEDLAVIHGQVGGDFTGCVMAYDESRLVREIALAMSRTWPTVVDVDGEFFGTGEQFAAELETGPGWALDR